MEDKYMDSENNNIIEDTNSDNNTNENHHDDIQLNENIVIEPYFDEIASKDLPDPNKEYEYIDCEDYFSKVIDQEKSLIEKTKQNSTDKFDTNNSGYINDSEMNKTDNNVETTENSKVESFNYVDPKEYDISPELEQLNKEMIRESLAVLDDCEQFDDLDSYFNKQWEEIHKKEQEKQAKLKQEEEIARKNLMYNHQAVYEDAVPSYVAKAESYNDDSVLNYKPVLDDIFTKSKQTVPVDIAEQARNNTNTRFIDRENIALMQNLEDGLSKIKLQLNNKGYNMRTYSKHNSSVTYYENSHMFISKIRAQASLFTFLLMIIEVFASYFIVDSIMPQKLTNYLLSIGVLTVLFSINLAICLATFKKKKLDRFNFKSSATTMLIFALPLTVLTFLIALFVIKIDIYNYHEWIIPIIYPICIMANAFIYLAIFNLVHKSKKYHLN